jgi:uncharacterized protein
MSDIRNNEAAGRYELLVDGEVIGFLDYRRRADDVIEMPHTVVDPEHGGKGYAADLTQRALDDARELGASVLPSCSYVARYIEKHPEYQHLLT